MDNARVSKAGGLAGLCLGGLAFGLAGCNDPQVVRPVGRLVQEVVRGPVGYTSAEGWRISIEDGAVLIRPTAREPDHALRYRAKDMRDFVGALDLRAWEGDRRSVILPGPVKVTMRGQGGALLRVSIYEGDESHEVDVLTQTVMHSRINATVARERDGREHDGETAQLMMSSLESSSTETLSLFHLYQQNEVPGGEPMLEQIAPRFLARQVEEDVRLPDPAPTYPAETEAACSGPPVERGGLSRLGDGSLQYASRSGLWTVTINEHTITAVRNLGGGPGAKWEIWGDPHENLNGKHIKDWETSRRTLLLDDGTKITLDASGPQAVVHRTSIYDGAQSHEIDNFENTLVHSCVHAATATQRDADEADGETAYLLIMRSPASAMGGLYSENIYLETMEDGKPVRIFAPEMLGETGEMDINPNNVRDFYDDPRLGHT